MLLSKGTWTSSTAHNLTLPGSHDAGPGKQKAPSVLDSWVKWKCVKRVEIQGLSRQRGAGLCWSKRFLGMPPKSEPIPMLFTQRHKCQVCWAPLYEWWNLYQHFGWRLRPIYWGSQTLASVSGSRAEKPVPGHRTGNDLHFPARSWASKSIEEVGARAYAASTESWWHAANHSPFEKPPISYWVRLPGFHMGHQDITLSTG